MIPEYRVVAFHTGLLTLDRAGVLFGLPRGTSVDIPMWSAAIMGGPQKILVDTGVHDSDWVNKNSGAFVQKPEEEFSVALNAATGWKPVDVDIVIHTHMHYDHVGNDRLCKNAEFYVQESEYECAFSPAEDQKWLYEPSRFLYDRSAVDYFAWRLVNGIYNVLPGIRLIPTPGHSVGHQSVLVNTTQGILCIAGDVVNMRENLWENRANGLCTSVDECLNSMAKIRKCADRVLPGHDPEITQFQSTDFPMLYPPEGK